MPLVTLTVRAGKSSAFKSAILDGVHRALIASGVPEKDRFQRVLELGPDDFRFDPERLLLLPDEPPRGGRAPRSTPPADSCRCDGP